MAKLSNINGKFAVEDTGAIRFSDQTGTTGQILKSNGNAAPTWVAASTVIGGPYLPLTGGTLSGPLSGTSATFAGQVHIDSKPNSGLVYNVLIDVGSAGDGTIGYQTVDQLAANLSVSSSSNWVKSSNNLDIYNTNSGNVGIGTDSPDLKLDVESTNSSAFSGTGYRTALFQSTSAVNADKPGITLGYDTTGGGIIAPATQAGTTNFLGFWTYNSGWGERVRIAKDGNVGIGNTTPQTTLHTGPTTTVTNVFTARFAASNFFASGGNSMFYVPDTAANIMMFGSNQFGTNQIEFYHKNPGTSQAYVGRISTSGSATSYVTSSDYRLKENIVPISDSISRLNQLKPSRFNFIEEPGKIVDGFIAHEVQDIVPEAIVGEKDEVDEDGGIIPQGIDQAKLVPLLVAAVQELEARVKELENK